MFAVFHAVLLINLCERNVGFLEPSPVIFIFVGQLKVAIGINNELLTVHGNYFTSYETVYKQQMCVIDISHLFDLVK